MTFTIEQLEALKDGTTPGPWGVDNSDPDWPMLTGPLTLDGNLLSQEILADLGGELSDPNFHMILATPALIDQLIAREKELQEILKKIKLVRDHYTWAIDPELRKQPFLGRIPTEANIYDALTQILEENQ